MSPRLLRRSLLSACGTGKVSVNGLHGVFFGCSCVKAIPLLGIHDGRHPTAQALQPRSLTATAAAWSVSTLQLTRITRKRPQAALALVLPGSQQKVLTNQASAPPPQQLDIEAPLRCYFHRAATSTYAVTAAQQSGTKDQQQGFEKIVLCPLL